MVHLVVIWTGTTTGFEGTSLVVQLTTTCNIHANIHVILHEFRLRIHWDEMYVVPQAVKKHTPKNYSFKVLIQLHCDVTDFCFAALKITI